MRTQIAIADLDLRYQSLRIADATAEAALAASLDAYGQREAVLVVAVSPDTTGVGAPRWIVIDGFRRIRAAQRLGHELIDIAALPMTEPEALVHCHRIVTGTRCSALEQAWLVQELIDTHRMSLRAVAEAFGRTVSWISRRVALVAQLPPSVQTLVRSGALSVHGAMRCLVPLARANAGQCEKIAIVAAREHLTTRQLELIHAAWRAAANRPEARDKIADDPLIALRAYEAIRTPSLPRSAPETRLADAMIAVSRAAARARQMVDEFVSRDLHRVSCETLEAGWKSAQISIGLLDRTVTQVLDARA